MCSNTRDIHKSLLISDLLLDERIYDLLEKHNFTFPKQYMDNLEDIGEYKLDDDKFNNLLTKFKDVNEWPDDMYPISVKGPNLKGLYQVVNGSHRLAISIARGIKSVPILQAI